FPGGKCDPEDEGDVVRTALRETQEEIGLDPNSVDIWCVMPRVDARRRLEYLENIRFKLPYQIVYGDMVLLD
ncbi:hypothetical protein X801_08186, partial [Opisthorchis viverrini]